MPQLASHGKHCSLQSQSPHCRHQTNSIQRNHVPEVSGVGGSQAHRMGGRISSVLQGVCIGAELLSPGLSRRAETLPPLGFNFNCGANYVPCIVTDNRGRGVLARYTRVIMGLDQHIIGFIPGDCSQYRGLLYAIPDHDQGEHPRYTRTTSGVSSTALQQV